jgi:hypothetical protein
MVALAACQSAPQGAADVAPAGYRPAIDFRGVDAALTVEPTKIMVLGTAHLANYESLAAADLAPLLDRLAAYDADTITIEHMRGEVCETLRAYPDEYPGIADGWCLDVSASRSESGLSAADGAARIRSMLRDWPDSPKAAERRTLAAAFLAAGEPHSALVQWWQLTPAERVGSDGIGDESIALLESLGESMNESTQIGVRLAVQLGLERVYGIEDFTSAIVLTDQGSALWDRVAEIWPTEDDPVRDIQHRTTSYLEGPNVLAAYRLMNSPEAQQASLSADFQRAMNDPEPEQYGRYYNSWHQVRNLRMVSAVMAAASTEPGGRVLTIVGSAHKPYFEGLLDQMHDVELVSTDTVLR